MFSLCSSSPGIHTSSPLQAPHWVTSPGLHRQLLAALLRFASRRLNQPQPSRGGQRGITQVSPARRGRFEAEGFYEDRTPPSLGASLCHPTLHPSFPEAPPPRAVQLQGFSQPFSLSTHRAHTHTTVFSSSPLFFFLTCKLPWKIC